MLYREVCSAIMRDPPTWFRCETLMRYTFAQAFSGSLIPPLVIMYVASRSAQSRRFRDQQKIAQSEEPIGGLWWPRERTWRILDLSNALLTAPFAEEYSGWRCMSKNMASDGFTAICACEQSTGARVTLYLIGLSPLIGGWGWIREQQTMRTAILNSSNR